MKTYAHEEARPLQRSILEYILKHRPNTEFLKPVYMANTLRVPEPEAERAIRDLQAVGWLSPKQPYLLAETVLDTLDPKREVVFKGASPRVPPPPVSLDAVRARLLAMRQELNSLIDVLDQLDRRRP